MGKILILLLLLIAIGAIWSLPLCLCINFVLWVFDVSFRVTWFQAYGICLLISVIKGLLNDK